MPDPPGGQTMGRSDNRPSDDGDHPREPPRATAGVEGAVRVIVGSFGEGFRFSGLVETCREEAYALPSGKLLHAPRAMRPKLAVLLEDAYVAPLFEAGRRPREPRA